MDRTGWLHDKLPRYLELLDVAAERFAALTDGLDHPRIDTARDRIESGAVALTRTAGGLSAWTRTWVGAALLGVAAWAAATIAGPVAGLSTGWTVAVTVAVVAAAHWPVVLLTNAVADRVDRRRTRRPEKPRAILEPDDPDPMAAILGLLWTVRDGLAILLRQWPDTHVIGVDLLPNRDRHLAWASVADRHLCVAIDSIEIWRDAHERER